ncbi:MAG TPA: glucosamine-6-phosphate deaminase [Cyclobacteriaceae bacterium]
MRLQQFKNAESQAVHTAGVINQIVRNDSHAVLCLATGDTPVRTYQHLVLLAERDRIDYSQVHFVGLDEWVGISSQTHGSCYHFLRENLFEPLQIDEANVHLFNGLSEDLHEECRQMDKTILRLNGIDLMLAGVGMNGHIGFNEPGVLPDLYSHVVDLDKITRSVGQKYFQEQTVLTRGITLGLKHFQEARTAILLASGLAKAEIVKQVLEGDISNEIPASFIQLHPNAYVFLDSAAASKLKR